MAMEDSDIVDQCTHGCLPNCEHVTYSYMMDTTALDTQELCQDQDEMREVKCINKSMFPTVYNFLDGTFVMECN